VGVIEELLTERQQTGRELPGATRSELEQYVEQLYASGRVGLADRLAASLVISSASQTAKRSSKQ